MAWITLLSEHPIKDSKIQEKIQEKNRVGENKKLI